MTLSGWNKNSSSQVILCRPNVVTQNSSHFEDLFHPSQDMMAHDTQEDFFTGGTNSMNQDYIPPMAPTLYPKTNSRKNSVTLHQRNNTVTTLSASVSNF